MTATEALERARREYKRAKEEPDLHIRFRAHLSAGMSILDAAMSEPENPRVKKAMKALLLGTDQKEVS